ncbi:ABC transporter substrate-binding protein [Pedobacter cryophilus]|uniref:histidine kinase n=1 Tax=Pedobacter cryophilus TaxID=2571271 RepID=A0A4U1C090_9SPHI|nr:ABC transporter substrate-binding protein [Pedobacter cryophilus]TKB96340.1 PAS domain S-box protein [Pedobacter cryophilus]
MRFLCLPFLVFSLFFSNRSIAKSEDLKPINLQLKWHHQFQFAGFYAAQIKGFYKKHGLDVNIIEGGINKPPLKQVLSGSADFGVTGSDILYEYIKGKKVKVTSVIFQHSPYVLMTLKTSNIRTLSDLVGKRIMVSEDQGWLLLRALFFREGIDLASTQLLPHSWNNEDLINGKADAFTAYSTAEPEQLRQLGYQTSLIKPSDYGLDFYGDLIFTSETYAQENSETVEAFNKASIEGWEYALSHKQEIINYILKLPGVKKRGITENNLLFEADETEKLVLSNIVEVGHVNLGRFQQMLAVYKELKLVPQNANIDGLIFKPTKYEWQRIIFISLIVLGIIFLLFIVTVFLNWRLRKIVNTKTKALLNEIEQRKTAEAVANESKEQIELILQSANICLWDWDLKTNQKSFSKQWYNLLGVNPQNLGLDFDPFSAIHPDDLEKSRKIFKQNMGGGRGNDLLQFRIAKANGEYIYILSSSKVIIENEKVIKLSGVIIDINEIKKKEQELIKISEELMQSNSELKKFAYIISHNLRGPVVNISSLFNMIEHDSMSDDNKIFCDKIGISVNKLEETLNDLIEIVSHQKPENKSLTVIDFESELKQIIASIEYQFVSSGAKITTLFDVRTMIYSKKYFESILINLITNALKYKSPHRASTIHISTSENDEYVILKVKDNGIGIDLDKNKSKIFGLYQRFTPHLDGKGIGLFIIKSHIESMNGKIEVDSKLDESTTFTIYFSKNLNKA